LWNSTFSVTCVISPKHKRIKSPPIILKGNSIGQVVNTKGKVVGMSGTVFATALRRGFNPMTYAQSLSKQKKKKKSFNPSRRN
jgi:S1-C subfamily serine protease